VTCSPGLQLGLNLCRFLSRPFKRGQLYLRSRRGQVLTSIAVLPVCFDERGSPFGGGGGIASGGGGGGMDGAIPANC
jgi:hypothetical protein